MAARYAVWQTAKGSSTNIQQLTKDINDKFFYNSFATVQQVSPVDHISSTGLFLLNTILSPMHAVGEVSDSGPYQTVVKFGIEQADLNSPSVAYPFSLMNTHVPFMTNSLMENFLSVNSQCQWAAIGDSWINKPSDPKGHMPLSELESIGGGINKTFSLADDIFYGAVVTKYYVVDYQPCMAKCAADNANRILHFKKPQPCNCNPPPRQQYNCF